MTMRPPVAPLALAVLGVAAAALAVVLLVRECEGADCIVRTLGGVFGAWAVLALGSLIRNPVGLVAFLSALAIAVFLGLVFVFARQPAGVVPPLLVVIMAALERDLVRAYYLGARLDEHQEAA